MDQIKLLKENLKYSLIEKNSTRIIRQHCANSFIYYITRSFLVRSLKGPYIQFSTAYRALCGSELEELVPDFCTSLSAFFASHLLVRQLDDNPFFRQVHDLKDPCAPLE